MPNTISHSEVDSFLACERRHYYAFGMPTTNDAGEPTKGLQPKRYSNGLYRGIVGHEALEIYYGYLADTQPIPGQKDIGPPTAEQFAEARRLALEVIPKAISEAPDRMELLLELQLILEAYFEYYQAEDSEWQIMAVEVVFQTKIDDDIEFPFKPDMVRRHRKSGRVEVMDHKFLANLYNANEIAIQPQLAKYVGSLRALGYTVDDGVYNLICHRVAKTLPYIPKQKMRRTHVNLSATRIEKSIAEQNSMVRSIAKLKHMTPIEWESSVRRTANSWNCKNCPFLSLCIVDLNGEDSAVMQKYEYEPNEYGYDRGDE